MTKQITTHIGRNVLATAIVPESPSATKGFGLEIVQLETLEDNYYVRPQQVNIYTLERIVALRDFCNTILVDSSAAGGVQKMNPTA